MPRAKKVVRPPGTLEGKVALVTGAGAGIGRAIAHALAAEGARVLVTDRDGASATAVAEEIVAAGGVADAWRVDVTSEADCAAMVARAEAELGPLFAAVNNAGVTQLGGEDDEAELMRTMAINVTGVRHAMKHELRVMRPRREGVIVNVASNAGLRPPPGMMMYSASKAAVIGLSRSVARLVGRDGVRVNALCPGAILTPLLHASSGGDAGLRFVARAAPVGRLGTPEEIGRTVAWMCGPDTTFMLGHALVSDGGMTTW